MPQESSRNRADDITSTYSADSDPDVTSYADSMVRQMEGVENPRQPQLGSPQLEPVKVITLNVQEDPSVPATRENRRASTPLTIDEEETPNADLSALESVLRVVATSESQLAELVDVTHSDGNAGGNSPAQQDNEAASSVGDAPPLPGGECKIHYLTDPRRN